MIDLLSDSKISGFRKELRDEFRHYQDQQASLVDRANCLQVDLHCHDHNSDVPDELWGRLLRLPETWLKTKNLVKCLKKNECDVVTITNHNNARSCWDLIAAGEDVLVAAEFTCYFPEYSIFVHVLAYGFNQQQEAHFNEIRNDIYQFLRYANEHNIPVILPHPLYLYTRKDEITLELFEKLAVLFQRFEVLNGQRDQWQSVLTLKWLRGLTAEKVIAYANKHQLNPQDFGVDPDQEKVLTGGSDDHMGIFAGECGSYLHVPDLATKLKNKKASELALDALREGRVIPYGQVTENQKLNIALLDYFSQVATKIEDPGLLRLFFHRGEVSDKLACLAISNFLLEIKKHKYTQTFFNYTHDALLGKKTSKLVKWKVKKDYKFCIEHLERIALSKGQSPEEYVHVVNDSVSELFKELNKLIVKRIKKKNIISDDNRLEGFSTAEIASKFEVPLQLTRLFSHKKGKKNQHEIDIAGLMDQLSFPVLVSVILLGTMVASTRLLYQNRRFLNQFSTYIGAHAHPKRALYLTDTLRDKNGVSNSLSGKLKEIQRLDLPVDYLICHADAEPESHLHVVRPLTTISVGQFGDQLLRVPDVLEIAKIFYEGGYDRIVCSTEGPMALVALLIKHMFNVPSYFFMHTDWIEFIEETTDLNHHEVDRVRRFLRFFYKQFEGVFVLNSEHRDWLTGHHMQLEADRVHMTAHHINEPDPDIPKIEKSSLFPDATDDTPVLLFSGRLSKEKGIFDLPDIFKTVQQKIPTIKLVIAGSGPAKEELEACLPDALFVGWVDKKRLSALYKGLDLKVFPSRFDTFGNVVLEAFSHQMPVVAYDCKGPKDIIEHNLNGFLVDDKQQMSEAIISYFSPGFNRTSFCLNAKKRSNVYQAEPIMMRFMENLGLQEQKVDELKSVV
ncbi:MAG: glycosyltransferase [Cycloclasticus sp.]